MLHNVESIRIMEAILTDAIMYSSMNQYRKNLTDQVLLFIRASDKLCVCKCTENQILADLYFTPFAYLANMAKI